MVQIAHDQSLMCFAEKAVMKARRNLGWSRERRGLKRTVNCRGSGESCPTVRVRECRAYATKSRSAKDTLDIDRVRPAGPSEVKPPPFFPIRMSIHGSHQ